MKTIKINTKKPQMEIISLVADHLKKGKVVVLPTDTIYGLHVVATDEQAIKKLIKIKKRDKNKPLLILVKSYCMLHDNVRVNVKQDKYIRKIWPRDAQNSKYVHRKKPTTFILESKGDLSKLITGKSATVAVRLPKNDFLIKILKMVNAPLISTSLNVSGDKVIENLTKIEGKLTGGIDLIIDGGIIKGQASQIIDIRDINNINIIRK